MNQFNQFQIQAPKQFIPPSFGESIVCNGVTYYIGNQIANGGFGAIYECSDDWGNRLVAKVILPQNRPYDQVREEWLHETNNLKQLRHPNITFIHEAFECRDTFYIVVERCDFTLQNLLLDPSVDGELWLPYVARDILHALNYIHSHGYVHKDLHAGNILVSKQYDLMAPQKEPVWSFKVADLGISRIEGDIRLFNTILAQWMLPPEYLSPGEFGVLGKHVDFYHVGLLLLSLIVKNQPNFSHQHIIDGEPRKMAENLNSKYSYAIAKALRRHVWSRPQSASEMWKDISAAASMPGQTTKIHV